MSIVHADKTMPFRIGSDHCPGLSKLIEEAGEVQQVLGKVMDFGGFGIHWDERELARALEKELGDLKAAITFVTHRNNLHYGEISLRESLKLHRFNLWHENIQNGRPPNTGVVYGEDE